MSTMHQLPGLILAATTTMKGKMATSLLCAGPLRLHVLGEAVGALLPVLRVAVDEEEDAAVAECGVGAVRDAGDGQGGRPGRRVAIDALLTRPVAGGYVYNLNRAPRPGTRRSRAQSAVVSLPVTVRSRLRL